MYTSIQMALCAYLLTVGYKFIGIAQINRKTCSFLLEDPNHTAAQDALAFESGATCPAKAFHQNLLRLRAAVSDALEVSRG